VADLVVSADGRCRFAGATYACALGSGGIRRDKREGDGATPAGTWPLRRLLYRSDRVEPPACVLPAAPIGMHDGWCDDPAHPDYNRPVALPFAASHERMWRDDHLYDLVVVVGHNDDPPVAGAGSAIFLHLMRDDGGPTAGCVAFRRADLTTILAGLDRGSRLVVEAP
jgi:L,D-peptidoglycan transpeptidase YkuD (ErfK/YbiS/YcfS/YnhG family)